MASEELAFLHRHKDQIIKKWRDYIVTSVNPDFFRHREFVTEEILERMFTYICQALDEHHYYDLNQVFDYMVDTAHEHYIGIRDVRGFLFGFIDATMDVIKKSDTPLKDYLHRRLSTFNAELRQVYSERLGRPSQELLTREREFVLRKWQRDLPSGAVSRHFTVVSKEKLREFVERTFDTAMLFLTGQEDKPVPSRKVEGQMVTALQDYLDETVDFFEPRGFAISDVERAISHLEEIAEPILYKAYRDEPDAYRRALWVIHAAVRDLALAFSEAYNRRLMTNFYEEVSVMLHRIKNKISPVTGFLQTVLGTQWEDVRQEGMLVTVEEMQVFERLQELRRRALQETLKALDVVEKALHSEDKEALFEQVREVVNNLRPVYEELRNYAKEHLEINRALSEKLNAATIGTITEFLQSALECGETTTALAKELQDIQNDLIKRKPPVWKPIRLDELVRTAFHESEPDAKQKSIEYKLEMDTKDGEVMIFGVEREIKRPFVQVINNAIKYTPEGGKVWVRLKTDDSTVTFSVQDTGIGIPKGEEAGVFELCVRCSNAQEFNPEGSGTGLYNDRKTVLQHNGEMWVESEGEGKGATFYIRLPIYRGEEEANNNNNANG